MLLVITSFLILLLQIFSFRFSYSIVVVIIIATEKVNYVKSLIRPVATYHFAMSEKFFESPPETIFKITDEYSHGN